MWTKNRIRLMALLGMILIIGTFVVLKNLRPVSEHKRKNSKKLDVNEELQKAKTSISILSDSIKRFPAKNELLLKRARIYGSINMYNSAISDFSEFVRITDNDELKKKALKELEAAKKIMKLLNKQKD